MNIQLIGIILFLIFYVIMSFIEYKKKFGEKPVDKRFIVSKLLTILGLFFFIIMDIIDHFDIALIFCLIGLIIFLIKMNVDFDVNLFLYTFILFYVEITITFYSVYFELTNCEYKYLAIYTSIGTLFFFISTLVGYMHYFKKIISTSKKIIPCVITFVFYAGTYVCGSIPFGFCYHINDVFINVTSQNQILVKNNNVNKKNLKNKVDKSGENLIKQVFFKGFSGFFNYSTDTHKKRITYVIDTLNRELEKISQKNSYDISHVNKFNESIKAISKSNLSSSQKKLISNYLNVQSKNVIKPCTNKEFSIMNKTQKSISYNSAFLLQ